MKRWYLVAAVAGLWPVAELRAQEGLAPTAPVVPAPVLQNGKILTPSGDGWDAPRPRLFATPTWSPLRNPATASTIEPTAPTYAQSLPPLPSGVSGGIVTEANCGAGGCGPTGRNRSCWERIKALLCYHPSPTELPKLRPTPYVTPLQGMFPCTSVAACGVWYGAGNNPANVAPDYVPPMNQPAGHPLGQPRPYLPAQGQSMLPPVTGATAGPVVMPPRGTQGNAVQPVQPTWQGRVVPESAVSAKSAPKPAAVPVPAALVPAGYKYPVPKPTQK